MAEDEFLDVEGNLFCRYSIEDNQLLAILVVGALDVGRQNAAETRQSGRGRGR